MKTVADPAHLLANGLALIREQYQVPNGFPPEVMAAAEIAAERKPVAHADWTNIPFVTLDPASSTDLDQAFAIERSGRDLLLRYAIADVDHFVDDGDVIDLEAWRRGGTIYLPDGKAGLYPPPISERAASLLPDGPRAAVVFSVLVAEDGAVRLDGAERAVIRSRAKLGYETATGDQLPPDFAELSDRIERGEEARGAARVDPPEQEVEALGDGHYRLRFRPRLPSEERNAAMSLATNLAIADALQAHRTGLFRVMDEPGKKAVKRLRHTAKAFDIEWPPNVSLSDLEKSLDARDPRQAAFMLAIRRAGQGAAYVAFRDGVTPWHSAMAATYAHATAPLRRLADRYVVRAALAIANGAPVPPVVEEAFANLPPAMARADTLGGQVERAVIDLAETAMLNGRVGTIFPAVVTDVDERGARIQLCEFPVVARLEKPDAEPGQELDIRLDAVDVRQRQLRFSPVA